MSFSIICNNCDDCNETSVKVDEHTMECVIVCGNCGNEEYQ